MAIKLLSVQEGDVSDGLIGNLMASIAEWESEVNGQRTRDALAQKFREGWQPSPLYIGYRSVGEEDQKKTCEPDPYVAPVIKQMFEIYSTGNHSILELQDWLSDKNILSRTGTIIGHSVINNILKNPFYYGIIRWHGESRIGKHAPIITKDLFDTCQYVLAKHRDFLVRKRTHDYLLRGFMYCSNCGQRYTADKHKINSLERKGIIHYYHCQKRDRNGCPALYVEADALEKQVEKEIEKMQFTPEFIDIVVQKAKDVVAENRRTIDAQKQGIINQKTVLEIKRNKLEDAVIDGTIDREAYQRKHTEVNDKITNLNNLIQEIENSANMDVNLIEEVLAFTRNIHTTYLQAPKFLKRHYLRFFFEKLIVQDKKIVKIVYTPIFSVLQENHAVIIRDFLLRD
ncbi:MAG TPA: recombinase family protein [Patescibacteria group bacterium]|nr:recombinase family protein [Patescibacteria group bacterium]